MPSYGLDHARKNGSGLSLWNTVAFGYPGSEMAECDRFRFGGFLHGVIPLCELSPISRRGFKPIVKRKHSAYGQNAVWLNDLWARDAKDTRDAARLIS